VLDEFSLLIEREHGRSGRAARSGRRILHAVGLLRFERARAMHDPDVVLGVHGDADCLADHPVIRERLRPHRIHFERGHLNRGSFHGSAFLEKSRSKPKRGNEGEKNPANTKIPFHVLHPS